MARKKRAIALEGVEETADQTRRLEKVHFRYVFPETYNPQYANGAHGGPTTQGEIAINFFVERAPLPLTETYAVTPEGQLGGKIGREPEVQEGAGTLVRYVTTGVIMSRDSAKRIHDFLGKAIATLEKAQSREQSKDLT